MATILPRFFASRDDQRDQFLVDQPLGVILDDDGVVRGDLRAQPVEKPLLALGVERRARFVVDAHDLLLVLDLEMVMQLARDRADARLVRRRPRGVVRMLPVAIFSSVEDMRPGAAPAHRRR